MRVLEYGTQQLLRRVIFFSVMSKTSFSYSEVFITTGIRLKHRSRHTLEFNRFLSPGNGGLAVFEQRGSFAEPSDSPCLVDDFQFYLFQVPPHQPLYAGRP